MKNILLLLLNLLCHLFRRRHPLKGLIGNAMTFCAEFRWAISLSDFEIAQRSFEIAQRNSAKNVDAFPINPFNGINKEPLEIYPCEKLKNFFLF